MEHAFCGATFLRIFARDGLLLHNSPRVLRPGAEARIGVVAPRPQARKTSALSKLPQAKSASRGIPWALYVLCNDMRGSGDFCDVRGLRALLALNDLKFHPIALSERLEAVPLNGAVVDEDVRPSLAGNEPEPL